MRFFTFLSSRFMTYTPVFILGKLSLKETPNLGGLFSGSFWGRGGAGKITPLL